MLPKTEETALSPKVGAEIKIVFDDLDSGGGDDGGDGEIDDPCRRRF